MTDGWLFSATHRTDDTLLVEDVFIPEEGGPTREPDALLAMARSLIRSGDWYQATLCWTSTGVEEDTDNFWFVCLAVSYRGDVPVADKDIQCQWLGVDEFGGGGQPSKKTLNATPDPV
jgi:hypothetical protein